MALPGSRVLEQVDGAAQYPKLRKRYKPPVIRAVCKEAWEVTDENGLFLYGPELTASGGTWFNPKQDVFVIRDPEADCPLGPLEQAHPEIIAIDRRYFREEQNFSNVLGCALEASGCRKVIILFRTAQNLTYKKNTAPKLFSLQPEDVIWSIYADDKPSDLQVNFDLTWKEFKDEIEGQWSHEVSQTRWMGYVVERIGLPVIEGMELIMCKEDQASFGF